MASAVKVFTLFSAGAALTLQAWLGAQEWPRLLPLTVAASLVGFVATRRFPRLGWAPWLIPAYIYPVVLLAARGVFLPAYHSIWLAALLAAIVATPGAPRWHLPRPWRLPLGFWALVVALGWPVVALREMDFEWSTLTQYSLANSGLGGPPPVVIVNMLLVVLTQLLGILWFDAMCARFRNGDPARFRREVVLPLAAGLAAGVVLAIYQWTIDIAFLSDHQWPYYGRAAGGLLDGNAFGALQGMWSGVALSVALTSSPAYFSGGIALVLMIWAGVWATGSRMALLTALVCIALVARAGLRGERSRSPGRRLLTAATALVVVGLMFGTLGRYGAHAKFDMDPISRITASLPALNRDSLSRFIEFELWNRFGPFGTASVRMIRDSPIVGVGTGTFEVLFPDYAYVVTGGETRSHFDNAQSWYRHRLAELGILGSVGWIAWVTIFGAFVWRAAPSRSGLTEATGVKAALVALALISLVSMPSRSPMVALTFWVFAFWLVTAAGEPSGDSRLSRMAIRRAPWVAVWIAGLVFVAGTGWVAHARLRPPYRAIMADWDYVHGISRPVRTDDGSRRYSAARGVAVFGTKSGYLRLRFELPHEDAERDPVRLRIFRRNTLVANLLIADRRQHELYIRVPEGEDRMMIQTHVSRVVPASNDLPARGLILHNWTFVRQPPDGAMIGGEVTVVRLPRNP